MDLKCGSVMGSTFMARYDLNHPYMLCCGQKKSDEKVYIVHQGAQSQSPARKADRAEWTDEGWPLTPASPQPLFTMATSKRSHLHFLALSLTLSHPFLASVTYYCHGRSVSSLLKVKGTLCSHSNRKARPCTVGSMLSIWWYSLALSFGCFFKVKIKLN